MLKTLEALGYRKVITTPHIMFDSYGNTKERILHGLRELQHEAVKAGIALQIEAASEYYLDEGLLPLIHRGELLLVAERYLLFETSYTHRPFQLEETVFEILAAGYIPLLAHPERYRYIKDPQSEFPALKALGVLFQVNLNSFGGYYGGNARKNALFLSKHGLIDFLGSDTHTPKQLLSFEKVYNSDYRRIYLNNTIQNNLLL